MLFSPHTVTAQGWGWGGDGGELFSPHTATVLGAALLSPHTATELGLLFSPHRATVLGAELFSPHTATGLWAELFSPHRATALARPLSVSLIQVQFVSILATLVTGSSRSWTSELPPIAWTPTAASQYPHHGHPPRLKPAVWIPCAYTCMENGGMMASLRALCCRAPKSKFLPGIVKPGCCFDIFL